MSVKNEDEAIRLANDTKYGLSASVWTGDLIKGQKIAKKIQAGYVCINNRGVETASLPWGGTKDSGFGKISSRFGLLNYVNIKCIVEDHSNKDKEDWWYPYNESKFEFYTNIIQNFHSDTMLGKLKAGSQFLKGLKDGD